MINSVKSFVFICILVLTGGYVFAADEKVVVIPLNVEVPEQALPQAHAYVRFTSTTPSFYQNYGFESVERETTGVYKLTLINRPSGFPVVIATPYLKSTIAVSLTYNIDDSRNVYIRVVDISGTPMDLNFSVIIYNPIPR